MGPKNIVLISAFSLAAWFCYLSGHDSVPNQSTSKPDDPAKLPFKGGEFRMFGGATSSTSVSTVTIGRIPDMVLSQVSYDPSPVRPYLLAISEPKEKG